MNKKSFTVTEIANHLGASYQGDGEKLIASVGSLESALASEITFFNNSKYKQQLSTTQAGCVLLSEHDTTLANCPCIIVADPYLAYAKVAQLLDTTPKPDMVVHAAATVSASAKLGNNVSVGPGVVIEGGCIIADDVILGPNVVIGTGSLVGAGTRIYANASIYHDIQIGRGCIIHAGAVIGADGFGFANEAGRWVKIPQLGRVIIADNVEVGANACIDRGALNDTLIGEGVKLDNFCHIAHNVELGAHVAMAAYSGVAGSSKIGEYSTFSGRSTILGHLEIAPRTHVTACSLINRSNKVAGVFSSGTGMQDNKAWRKNVARFRQLDDMAKQLKSLQKELERLKNNSDK